MPNLMLHLLDMQVTFYLSRLTYTASLFLVIGSIIAFQTPCQTLVLFLPSEDATSGCATKETTILMRPDTAMN